MKKQQGFTLIEIIAVLVILGILAAVAIPKYQDLQEAAADKAAEGAVAAAQSQLSMAYSELLLTNNGAIPAEGDVVTAADCPSISGDFTITCTAGTGVVDIAATSTAGGSATGTWTMP